MRLKNIDLFKGLLIIFVILGHLLQGELNESIWRTIIYSFHMPIFVGISGYLFNVNKVIQLNVIGIIRKYQFRVIFPWVIAISVYFLLFAFQTRNFKVIELVKSFAYPYYHLWYIPGFLSWVVLTWYFEKNKISNKGLLFIALFISTFSLILKEYPELYYNTGLINSGVKLILHTFRPYFYFFFVLGFFCKRLELKRPKIKEYLLPIIGFTFVVFLFYHTNKLLSIINFLLFNSFLLIIVLKLSVNSMIQENKALEWLGQNSLAIYLWHVIPILVCKFAFGSENLFFFYITAISFEVLFIVTYIYLIRISILKKYVFGM